MKGAQGPWNNIIVGGPFKLGSIKILLLRAHLNWGHLNIILGGILKLFGKNKLKRPGPPGSILLFGAHLN